MTLPALIEKLRGLKGPDREVDAMIAGIFTSVDDPRYAAFESGRDYPDTYTASLDAVVDLIERELPGWAWKVGTCSVSDDAWLVPDFNSPEHGERLKRELSYDTMVSGDTWDVGIDIDQRPAGRPAIALLIAFLEAKMEMEK